MNELDLFDEMRRLASLRRTPLSPATVLPTSGVANCRRVKLDRHYRSESSLWANAAF